MTEETLDAAILLLRSRGLEAFGLIKDIYAREREAGDAEKIANLSLQMANLEGGMITLQQYKESIVESAKQRALDLQTEETPEPEEDNETVITEDTLRETSESFRRSLAHKRVAAEEIDES